MGIGFDGRRVGDGGSCGAVLGLEDVLGDVELPEAVVEDSVPEAALRACL